ncbi:hypothetical protein QBC46DRAFT_39512 [Diplogelasinospora grovesii]|uniref:ABC toxin N-terminal domain-containing protein n=1 Tax=Diplogelasinospora grovesii TaxID=303347 RepID=A0AAN6NCM0_9PEZI|nr:hypothetical protein QBC46DRAFT_39512 [Diplogelasinospora grovesii]
MMDDKLETITCTQAAISAVQMFVQRCLLGLEPEAATANIDQAKWASMSQYSLWQATRIAENRIELSPRDEQDAADKSDC